MRALVLFAALAACDGFDRPSQPTTNAQPIAHAGTGSFYASGETITLDGSESFDPDGTIVDCRWSVVQRPPGSTREPADDTAMTTTFTLDRHGTYVFRLVVTDDGGQIDYSGVRVVATGAILGIDAGPAGAVSWLARSQLAGTVSTAPGSVATYSWSFVSRPPGSTVVLTNPTSLAPSFVADATGTYVLSLEARVGDEVASDTTTVEATAVGISLGTSNVAYTYAAETIDRIVAVRTNGARAEVVKIDPASGAQSVLDIGAFTPRSIAIDSHHGVVAVGGVGTVAVVGIGSLTLVSSRAAPGCTANQVLIPHQARVDCFPEDGMIEPISSVNMTTGEVTQIASPVRFPSVAAGAVGWVYMVDAATPQFYLLDGSATPPLPVLSSGTLAGIAPPVIAAGNQPFAITGNGLAINVDATLRFDLQTSVSAGAFAQLRNEIAIVSGSQLKVFDGTGQTLKLNVTLPSVSGVAASAKLLAYDEAEHQLIIVASTPAGDNVYMVPR